MTTPPMSSDTRGVGQAVLDLDYGSGRDLLWIDGVASAVMGHLMLAENPDAQPAHCDLGTSVDADSHRFIDDLEQWYGKAIIRLRNPDFTNIDEVFERRKYLSGMNGAPCTGYMKFSPREMFELPSDRHYWGYTADKLDVARFDRMVADYPFMKQRAPLVEMGVTKKDAHAILRQHGIKRPRVYDLGFPNGNCIGCVKSSSPNYWALIRKEFPEVFERRNDQCRRFGARLVILGRRKDENGKSVNVRGFLDEIPADQPTKVRGADFGGCGFHCKSDATPTSNIKDNPDD